MYGYEIEVKDDAPWKEKLNIFSVLVPLIKEDESNTGLLNKTEIIDLLVKTTMDALHESFEKKTVQEDFQFYNEADYFETVFNLETFIDIIDTLAKYQELKVYLEGTSFYMDKIFSKIEYKNSEEKKAAIKDLYEKFISQIGIMMSFPEGNAPSSEKDFTILNFMDNKDKIEYNLAGLVNSHNSINYGNVITEKMVDILVDENILNFSSFQNILDNSSDINVDEITQHRDIIEYFLQTYIDNKVTTKQQRKEIINVLDNYKNETDDLSVFLLDCLNNVLLEDTPNRNSIKADWLGDNLNIDAGVLEEDEDEDDPFKNL